MKFFKFLSAVIVSFFILSCSGLNLDSKTGSISIRLPEETSETRAFTTQEKYDLSFTISVIDSDHNTVDQKDGTPGAEVVFNELQVGAYIVHCRCYANIDGKQHVYAQAKDTVEILADKVAQLTLTLKIETEFLPKELEDNKVTEPKEDVEIPGGSQNTEPKDPENSGDQGESGEGTPDPVEPDTPDPDPETPPAYLSDFNGAETYSCTDWNDLVEKINALADTGIAVFSVSGRIDASTDISLNKGRKVLLKASGDTTINISDSDSGTDLISLGNGKLVIYGSDDAKITFTGERSTSIFNVNNSDAELIVAGNVEFENFICTNQYAGGAVYVAQGVCSINGGVTFTNCKATKSNGGAINAVGGQLYVTGETLENPVIFNSCKAAGNGGAIYIEQTRESELATLLNIQFGTETGKENSCGGNGPDICINSNAPYSESVSIDGYIGSASDRIDIYAADIFVLNSYIETTSEIYITFNDEAFNKAVAKSEPLLNTNLTPYEENLRSLIYVRAESDGDMWKNITEDGMVINE